MAYHAAGLTVPVKVGCRHSPHVFRIGPVDLGSTDTPIDENDGWLECVFGDAVFCQEMMDPEAVTPRLELAIKYRRCATGLQ